MYRYDTRLDPPAPLVPVRIINTDNGLYVVSSGLVDTCAFQTVIPQALALQLGLQAVGDTKVIGASVSPMPALVYRAQLEVAEVVLGNMLVLAMPISRILLGRDLLNQFDITLRGKAQTFEMVPA